MTTGSERQRRFRITIRFSAAEHLALAGAAERAGLTLSGYARHVLVAAKPLPSDRRPAVEKILLARILGQLGKIGSNLNQIAHALNTYASGLSPAPVIERNLTRALAELGGSRRALLQALGRHSSP